MWWTISPISSMWPTTATDSPSAGAGHARHRRADRVVRDLGERRRRVAEHGGRGLLIAGGAGCGEQPAENLG